MLSSVHFDLVVLQAGVGKSPVAGHLTKYLPMNCFWVYLIEYLEYA